MHIDTANKIQKQTKKHHTPTFSHTWNVSDFQFFENIARLSAPQPIFLKHMHISLFVGDFAPIDIWGASTWALVRKENQDFLHLNK